MFEFSERRGSEGPAKFLSDFSGHVTVDAYGVNDEVYLGATNKILAACGNSHASRKFTEAKPNDSVAAAQAIANYRALYDMEGRSKGLSARLTA